MKATKTTFEFTSYRKERGNLTISVTVKENDENWTWTMESVAGDRGLMPDIQLPPIGRDDGQDITLRTITTEAGARSGIHREVRTGHSWRHFVDADFTPLMLAKMLGGEIGQQWKPLI